MYPLNEKSAEVFTLTHLEKMKRLCLRLILVGISKDISPEKFRIVRPYLKSFSLFISSDSLFALVVHSFIAS